MSTALDIYALNSNFEVIAVGIPYDNLQWNRKYYESGDFSMRVALSVYDSSWKYIGTKDRPELGMVQQVQLSGSSDLHVQISGFFCEKMLDDKTIFPKYKTDVAKTETAIRDIFSRYKDDLPIGIEAANNPLLGDRTQLDFSDDELGKKLYSILETRQISYRVRYNYTTNRLNFGVWQGKDRTQSQSVNGYQVFSTEFGNIAKTTVDLDDSAYKNYAIVPANANEDDIEQDVFYIDHSNGGYKKEIVFDMRSRRPEKEREPTEDEPNPPTQAELDKEYRDSVIQEATERLESYSKVEDIDVDMVGDSGYMVDYDLGDKCDVILNNLGIQMQTRIVEVSEVFKKDGHTLTVGLGNKRISNIRRAVIHL